MNKDALRIVYMGTADFAVAPLKTLVEAGFNVVGVVTMPDKPAGRGLKLQGSKVKSYALEAGLKVLQPERLKDEGFVQQLRDLNPTLGVVVAFRMLPEVVWALPTYGTINLHGSLLPRYRGAAPIHWAVINGDEETGVTTFRLKHELDTGSILRQASLPIPETATTGEIYAQLMALGAEVLRESVELFLSGEPSSTEQGQADEARAHAPKLTKENTQIDWHMPARRVYNMVRGLSPFPSAWCYLQLPGMSEPLLCKIHAGEPLDAPADSGTSLAEGSALPEGEGADRLPAGTVIVGKKTLDVVCGEGVYRITQLQPSGKKSMPASAFVNGLPR